MQFATLTLAALSIGSALAQQVMVHVVTVGNSNGSLTYSPNNLVAAKGDMVQFQFMPKNHTVTQSNFDKPCEPISLHSNVTGVYSGFMPVAATDTTIPTYTILINNTNPMWLYCSQGKHCQSGMSMVINQNTTANATRSLENYQSMAKNVANNLAPGTPADGTAGSATMSASAGSGSGYGAGYGASTTANSGASSTSSAGASKSTTSAGVSAFETPKAWTFVVGLALAVVALL